MVTTSCFKCEKNINNPVRISRKGPRRKSRAVFYEKLAPPKYLIDHHYAGSITEQEYTEEYYRVVLSRLDPQQVLDEIISLFGEDATLLCFEDAGKFCHRRLVADWIEKGTGVNVPELTF